jgi:hypothetical protein
MHFEICTTVSIQVSLAIGSLDVNMAKIYDIGKLLVEVKPVEEQARASL